MMMVVRVCVCGAARLGAKGDTLRRPARASFAWRNFAFFNFTYEGPLGPAIGRTSEVVAGGARTFFERVFDGWGWGVFRLVGPKGPTGNGMGHTPTRWKHV